MKQKTEIYHNEKQFRKAWLELRKEDGSLPEQAPKVDFKEKLIIGCFAGTQTNGLEADSLWINKGELVIRLIRLSLQPKCHEAKLLVTPFVFIETDRSGWNVLKEQERVRIIECE